MIKRNKFKARPLSPEALTNLTLDSAFSGFERTFAGLARQEADGRRQRQSHI